MAGTNEAFAPGEISALLDLSKSYVEQSRRDDKKVAVLKGRTVINVFFPSCPEQVRA